MHWNYADKLLHVENVISQNRNAGYSQHGEVALSLLPSFDLNTFAEHSTLRNPSVGAASVIADLKPAFLDGFMR